MVLVRDLGGFGAARIDHHQLAATRLQRLQAAAEIRHGHDAAVGGHGVVAEHQQMLRAVDVGDGLQELVAVHPQAHEMVRQLVGGGGGVVVARAQAFEKVIGVGHQSPVVHIGIAAVDGHGIGAVLNPHGAQSRCRDREGLLPVYFAPAAAFAEQRAAQPVGVFLQIGKRGGLGADVTVAQGVVAVAADVRHAAVLDAYLEAADRLAQVAGAVVRAHAHDMLSPVSHSSSRTARTRSVKAAFVAGEVGTASIPWMVPRVWLRRTVTPAASRRCA